MSAVAIVLANEAEDAARHEHTMFVSFTAQASLQTNPQGRARLLRLAAEARTNALSWARLSNWLQLRVTLGLALLLAFIGCNAGSTSLVVTEEYEPPERVAIKVIETIMAGETLQVRAECPEDAPKLVLGGCIWGGFQGSVLAVTDAPEVIQADGAPVEPIELTTWICAGHMPAFLLDPQGEPFDPGAGSVTAYAVCEIE